METFFISFNRGTISDDKVDVILCFQYSDYERLSHRLLIYSHSDTCRNKVLVSVFLVV